MVGSHRNHTHVDKGALKWAKELVYAHNFLDIGCSIMGMIELAVNDGIEAWGLDADINLLYNKLAKYPERLIINDFRYTDILFPIKFNIVWSVETAEHIPEEYVMNYVNTCVKSLHKNGIFIMTHGLPHTLGDEHVHCKEEQYWIDIFEKRGLTYKSKLTQELKKHSTMQREFIQNTGKVFMWS